MKLVKKTEQKVIESGDGRKATQTSEREEKQKRKMRETKKVRERKSESGKRERGKISSTN